MSGETDLSAISPSNLKNFLRSALQTGKIAAAKNRISKSSTDFLNKEKKVPRSRTMEARKEIEVAVHFLQGVLRSDKSEMLIGCINAVFDAVIDFLSLSKENTQTLQNSLFAFLQWDEDRIRNADAVQDITNNERGIELATNLLKALQSNGDKSGGTSACFESDRRNFDKEKRRESLIESMDSGYTEMSEGTTTTSDSNPFNRTEMNLDELLAQLNLRQIAKFEPIFPSVSQDESDDDDFPTIDEQREEREEKKDSKTSMEEVQRLADGCELRKKKTSTFNKQETSKQVTIRSHGGGREEVVKRFNEGDSSFNEDLQTDDFFSTPWDRFGRRRHVIFDDVPEEETNLEKGMSQKIKKVEHSDKTIQKVTKTSKRNGKLIADDLAEKQDSSKLDAHQVETFKDDKLVDRKGDGSYEEQSIVKTGLSSILPPPPIPPKRRHIVEYMQTFGDKKTNGEDFFRGSTLASYIILNDNLRYHEEQFRKKIQFEFGHAANQVPTKSYSNLTQILQVSDHDRVRLPKRYLDSTQEDDSQENYIGINQFPALCSKSILEHVDVSDWLVLRAKDAVSRPNEIRGGPKDALVAFATQPCASLLYQEAFLTTYRTFITSAELISKLIKRYIYMWFSDGQTSAKSLRQSFSLLVRVVDELCAIEITADLIRSVTTFINRLVRDGSYTFAKLLRKRLMNRIEQKYAKRAQSFDLPTSLKSERTYLLFDFRSSAVAKQMTLLDSKLFQKIEPPEMLWWSMEQDEKKSPNLCSFTEHFNKVSYWVRTLVLQPEDQRTREKYLLKFTKVMKQLRSMGNYNSYLAILSALDSGPVRRLDWSKHTLEALLDHSTIMDSSHSFRNYRNLLADSLPPCLPYIGLVLQDLTFVHIGNNDYIAAEYCNGKKNLLNFGKRWQQFAILDSVRRFKSWNYSIEKDERIIQFFDDFKNYLSEDDIWDLSESIKPRLRKNK